MHIFSQLTCFCGRSGLWVPREYLLELGTGIKESEREVKRGKSVRSTGDGGKKLQQVFYCRARDKTGGLDLEEQMER